MRVGPLLLLDPELSCIPRKCSLFPDCGTVSAAPIPGIPRPGDHPGLLLLGQAGAGALGTEALGRLAGH